MTRAATFVFQAVLVAALLVVGVERGDEWLASRRLHARLRRDLGASLARGARIVWWEEGFFTWTGEGFSLRVVQLRENVGDPEAGRCPPGFTVGSIDRHPGTHLARHFDVDALVCRKQRRQRRGHGIELVVVRRDRAVYYSG